MKRFAVIFVCLVALIGIVRLYHSLKSQRANVSDTTEIEEKPTLSKEELWGKYAILIAWEEGVALYAYDPLHINSNIVALASEIRRSEAYDLTVGSGHGHITLLCEYLTENQVNIAGDCRESEISAKRSSPTQYKVQYPVEAVEEGLFHGQVYYKITTTLIRNGDVVKENLYAFETVLDGYVPQVGDDITGIVWLNAMASKTNDYVFVNDKMHVDAQ